VNPALGMGQNVVMIKNKDTNWAAERKSKELSAKGCLLLVQESQLRRVRTMVPCSLQGVWAR